MSYTRGGRPSVTRSSSIASSRSAGASRSAGSPGKDLRALELSESFVDDEDSHKRPDLSRAHRSSTITSLGGFDFRDGLLPLTLSGEGAEAQAAVHDDEKHVGVLHGMALVVGMQVGSGIFSSPGVVVAEVGSAGASLAVWVLSGVLAWTGASSFAELGCAIPISGGAQAYLAYSFGPMLSYLYTWSAVSSLKPGSSAIIALIFGEYVNRMIYHAISGDEESPVPEWSFKLTAVIAIILVSILNLVSRTMGTRFSVMITTVKIGSLIFVFILGLISLLRNGPGPSLTPSTLFEGTSSNPGSYALALYSGLWAFDGWDQCNVSYVHSPLNPEYLAAQVEIANGIQPSKVDMLGNHTEEQFVAGEMHNPDRDLPRTIHSSMLLVLGLFLAANISYFVVLDPATVASSNTVALDFGRVTIGRFGAVVFSTLVAISCFGALSNGFYTTARLIYASARDHQLPELFTHLHHKRRTPDNAMALQAGFTIFFVIFGGGFRSLLNFFSVTSWTFYLLTVLGLLILRVKEPHLNRPYKAWIITPITFCIVAAFLLLMPIFAAPLEAFAAFVFMSAGVPMYYVTARSRARQASKSYTDDGGGVRAILEVAWAKLRDDIEHISPLRWRRAGYRPPGTARVERVFDEAEERAGMLRSDRLEMSER